MNNKIFVVGNGFDLHHGMKTNYMDMLIRIRGVLLEDANFPEIDIPTRTVIKEYENNSLLKYLLAALKNQYYEKTWIDMESEIKELVNKLLLFLDAERTKTFDGNANNEYKYGYTNKLSSREMALVENLICIFEKKRYDYIIKKRFITTLHDIDIMEIMKALNIEMEKLEQIVKFYLQSVEPLYRNSDKYVTDSQIQSINPDYVISFNYTNTMEELYGINKDDIFYIHGDLNKDNIVLGYDDRNESSRDIIFKKFYRRIIKHTDNIDVNRFFKSDDLGGYIKYDLYFYGHSLDVSDEDILCRLIKDSDHVNVFYMDQIDYSNKVLNLIQLLSKEEVIDKINSGEFNFIEIKSN